MLAFPAVVPGALQPHRPERGGDGLVPDSRVGGLPAAAAPGARAAYPSSLDRTGLQQRRAGGGQHGAHRLLQHGQPVPGAEHPRGQPRQPAYLGGGDLLEPRREPPLSPPAGGEAAPAVTGRAAQIASLT